MRYQEFDVQCHSQSQQIVPFYYLQWNYVAMQNKIATKAKTFIFIAVKFKIKLTRIAFQLSLL